MVELTFWPQRILFKCLSFLWWCLLSIFYWGERKTVPPVTNPLLLKSATKLAEEIREGKLKSEEVVKAYINRILEVNPIINAIVEDNFRDALEEAKYVDSLLESNEFSKEQLGLEQPLLGVPFTVKILVKIKGFRCTSGCLLFKDRIADADAPTVTLLKKAGGILLATTNSPEFGNAMETNNMLHGKTCNPYDTTRVPGGSSGGESALISAAGSIIGIANDLMGSVRFPAHFCGLFAHKATVGWISNEGCTPQPPPACPFMYYVTPMCRYAEDLQTMLNVLSPGKENRIHIDQKIDFKKLKIYYQTEIKNAWMPPTDEDIVQAIVKATKHFKETYGSEVKKVNISLLKKSLAITIHCLSAKVPSPIAHATDGLVTHINGFTEFIKLIFAKSTFSMITILAQCFRNFFLIFNRKNVPYYEDLGKKMAEEFNDLLDENSVFFCVTAATSAPHHYGTYPLALCTAYTGTFNYLGLPSTQCPLGLNHNNMPIGMQIVGRKHNDALTIACANELEKVFGGWIPPEIACQNNNTCNLNNTYNNNR